MKLGCSPETVTHRYYWVLARSTCISVITAKTLVWGSDSPPCLFWIT